MHTLCGAPSVRFCGPNRRGAGRPVSRPLLGINGLTACVDRIVLCLEESSQVSHVARFFRRAARVVRSSTQRVDPRSAVPAYDPGEQVGW
jgi:hypothetical protein